MGPDAPATWHYGLVAKWWAEFNGDGPEIAYFQRPSRGPAGPRRRLRHGTAADPVPSRRSRRRRLRRLRGHDRALPRAGRGEGIPRCAPCSRSTSSSLPRTLQHDLRLRRLRPGSDREHDVEALRRLFDHLEPGRHARTRQRAPVLPGLPVAGHWLREARRDAPAGTEPPDSAELRRGSDGSKFGCKSPAPPSRPARAAGDLEMRAEQWRDGELVAAGEAHAAHQLLLHARASAAARGAGFTDVVVHAGHRDEAADGGRRLHRLRREEALACGLELPPERDESGVAVLAFPARSTARAEMTARALLPCAIRRATRLAAEPRERELEHLPAGGARACRRRASSAPSPTLPGDRRSCPMTLERAGLVTVRLSRSRPSACPRAGARGRPGPISGASSVQACCA